MNKDDIEPFIVLTNCGIQSCPPYGNRDSRINLGSDKNVSTKLENRGIIT